VQNYIYSVIEWHQKFAYKYKHTTFGAFFEPLAQVWQFMVSTTKELSEKYYIGAHVQSRGYKVLLEFYL